MSDTMLTQFLEAVNCARTTAKMWEDLGVVDVADAVRSVRSCATNIEALVRVIDGQERLIKTLNGGGE